MKQIDVLFGAATLNDGRQFQFDQYLVIDESEGHAELTNDEFIQLAKQVGVKDIEGSGCLTEADGECNWYVQFKDGTFISLYSTQEVNDWLTSC